MYCAGGCAVAVKGQTRMQLYFARNKYEYMVSLDGGSIYDANTGIEEVSGGNLVTTFWNERVKFSFGKTAIRIKGQNEPLTFVHGSTFTNMFSDQSGTFSLENGGGLYVKDSVFKFDEEIKLEVKEKTIS
jgi:hypothetical protein